MARPATLVLERLPGRLRLYLGGDLQFDTADEAIYHERLAHPALMAARARFSGPLDVLVLGGGDGLAVRELLLQAAGQLGVQDIEPIADHNTGRRETPEEAIVRAVIEREVKTPEPDEETCRRYYESNRRRFRAEDLFEAAHILFLADPQDE